MADRHSPDVPGGQMSQAMLAEIGERARADAQFLAELQRDPEHALARYELSEDERAAVLRGEVGRLQELGRELQASAGGGEPPLRVRATLSTHMPPPRPGAPEQRGIAVDRAPQRER